MEVRLHGVNALLYDMQVKSVKTGSIFWAIGCCLSYFYMVRTFTQTGVHKAAHSISVDLLRRQSLHFWYGHLLRILYNTQ